MPSFMGYYLRTALFIFFLNSIIINLKIKFNIYINFFFSDSSYFFNYKISYLFSNYFENNN